MTILDAEFIDRLLSDLTPEEFRLIIATFGRDLQEIPSAMEAAAASGDRNGFARHAHRLAGAAGAVGAAELSEALRALSRPEPDRDLDAALAGIRTLGHAALTALIARRPQG